MTTKKKDIDTREFEGRVALITGAATGLGYVIAQEFHARGAFTVMVDQSNEVKEKASVLGSILRTCGTIDTVVNNVGKYTPVAISDITEDDFDDLIAINLKTVFLVTQCFMKDLLEQPFGRVVNIASSDAYIPKVTNAHYAAAKAGVVSLTKTFAAELAPHVLVNGVSPGPISTETAQSQGWLANAIKRNPLGRAAAPSDIAEVVLFLASEKNRFINGETVIVNGGATMV
jgi:3-oxoacyl-[acyl-carrier protein] reductase